jgi:hypothetical protein
MPWQETNPVLERRHFIHDAQSGHWRMSELCLRYGVSRVTGYKWLDRRFTTLSLRQADGSISLKRMSNALVGVYSYHWPINEASAQLASVPAAVVVANHVMGLYELGAIHLSADPPMFGEAQLAIDAMADIALPAKYGAFAGSPAGATRSSTWYSTTRSQGTSSAASSANIAHGVCPPLTAKWKLPWSATAARARSAT